MKVNLPEPCHEDWSKMDSQEKGRFCGSCQKLVIDFSVMSDTEIVNYFKEYKGQNTCGHFKKTQIDRKLKEQETPRRKLFLKELAAACFAFFLASTDAKAQGGVAVTDKEIAEHKQRKAEQKAIENQGKEIAINGKIVNGKEVLSNATISIKGTEHKTLSLENGFFSIYIPNEIAKNQEFVTLVVEFEGFETKEIEITTSPTNQFVEVDFEKGISISDDIMLKSTITGTVKDEFGETLPSTTVQIKGTNHGTVTDIDGNYSLVLPDREVILVYRYVGLDAVEEIVGSRTVINVQLESSELLGGAMFCPTYKWYSPKGWYYKVRNIFR